MKYIGFILFFYKLKLSLDVKMKKNMKNMKVNFIINIEKITVNLLQILIEVQKRHFQL